jgi:hypothetical protein
MWSFNRLLSIRSITGKLMLPSKATEETEWTHHHARLTIHRRQELAKKSVTRRIEKLARIHKPGHRMTGILRTKLATPAGSSSTSPSTTTPASPSPPCSPTKKLFPPAASCVRAIAYFAQLGISIRRVMTDDGPAFARCCSPKSVASFRSSPSVPASTLPHQRQS